MTCPPTEQPRLVVPVRFNGPPRSGNGGWAAGAVAQRLSPGTGGPAARVRLAAPPPLDRAMAVEQRDGELVVRDGETVVARAHLVPDDGWLADEPPAAVGWQAAQDAAAGYRGRVDHPFPTCFTCGTARPDGDGLALHPGPLPDLPDVTASAWTPAADLANEGTDCVSPEVAWAALDCPGGWSVDLAGRPMVLGTMTARVAELPRIGARHVVMGRVLRQEGRKAWTETALYALDGDPNGGSNGGSDSGAPRLIARAAAVWIAVDPAGVRPTTPAGTAE